MLRRIFQLLLICICFLSLWESPQADENVFPPDVLATLEKADSNRVELEKAISHYRAQDDSLKLESAYFLIGNMDGHAYATYALFDSAKNEIQFDVTDYPTYDTLLLAWDTLEAAYPGLDFDKKEIIYDLKTVTADFLIKQVDEAFSAWRSLSWAEWITFEQFKEYILPYRGSNEPLDNTWRTYFFERYKDLTSRMKDPSDPIEAARLINDDVKTWFTFDPRYYYHPQDQGLGEMLSSHLGRCEDMTNATIYAMRAMALAVTSDYTPYWANSGNNHAWNSILIPNGKVVPFMGAEANPGEYKLWNKLAKVYRKMYSKQKGNLVFQERKQKAVPGWLGGKSYIDVTSDYVEAVDVTIDLATPAPDSVDIAYICVFNDGNWRPIHWGRIEGDQVTFTAMGPDIAYLPAYFVKEDSIAPAGPPFVLAASGDITLLKPSVEEMSTAKAMTISSKTGKELAISTDGVKKAPLTTGASYELFYWDNGWKSVGVQTVSDQPLNFNVPPNCFYWLIEAGSNKDERIFTLDDYGNQVWW